MTKQIEFSYSKLTDVKGFFAFEADSFVFSTRGKKQSIRYDEVASVIREYYDRKITFGIAQTNPNQYKIILTNDTELVLRVAHKEEDSYQKKIKSLEKKIYRTNALGVGLASTARRNAAINPRQKAIQFEKEKPARDFSLEKAIQMLLEKCGIGLNDLTDYQAAKTHAEISENTFVELAKLISDNDETVVTEVFTHVAKYERYYQEKTKNYPHRGMNENTPKNLIRWFALIDTLKEHGYAAEIDWKEDAENIANSLSRIKEKMGIELDTEMDFSYLDGNEEVETLETDRILNLIGVNTVEHGYTLANMVIYGDSYLICLVPNKVFKQCEKQLQDVPFEISAF